MAYLWRQLTDGQRGELLAWRRDRGCPWHSPPHRPNEGFLRYHITASCFEHHPHIGLSLARAEAFAQGLLEVLSRGENQVHAWCVLPNHYHALVATEDVLGLLREIGRMHGRTSHAWNGEENKRGRQVFFRAAERAIRSDRHFWATINYVHHNPVHHGYVTHWTDWPWSSARQYLGQTDPQEARRIWLEYPILEYGKGWDEPAF